MKRTLKRIAPLACGKVLGVLYGCMGLIFLPFFALAALAGAFASPDTSQSGANALAAGVFIAMGLAAPFMYGIFGFIFGVISAAVYNLVARWVGGIEVEVE